MCGKPGLCINGTRDPGSCRVCCTNLCQWRKAEKRGCSEERTLELPGNREQTGSGQPAPSDGPPVRLLVLKAPSSSPNRGPSVEIHAPVEGIMN